LPLATRAWIALAVVWSVGEPSCLVTSSPQFPSGPPTRPFLVAADSSPPLSAVLLIDAPKDRGTDGDSFITFRSVVQSEDNGAPLQAKLVADFDTAGRTPFVLGRTEVAASVLATERVVAIDWHTSALTGVPLATGCHSIALVVTHAFGLGTDEIHPAAQDDVNWLTWWVLVGDPAEAPTLTDACPMVAVAQAVAPAP
jgi:hypothetical protein